MKKILSIIGARPQFIKAAPLSRALKKSDSLLEISVHTGQHYDTNMSDIFFKEMDIPRPAYNLNIGSGSHAEQTGAMLIGLEKVIAVEKPDLVLIYGDTNSTLAGALVAAKLQVPIAHVEAGLRSFNMKMPEEINRIVADRLSAILLCPTSTAVGQLKKEGITRNVYHTGDVMYDAALQFSEIAEKKSTIMNTLCLKPKSFFLATIHRQENADDKGRLTGILTALGELAKTQTVVLPLHPRTSKMIHAFGLKSLTKDILLSGPLGFLDMILLEKNAFKIMTDSGGVQKEAYFHGTPCITLRDETEWVETVEAGWNVLANAADAKSILAASKWSGAQKPISEYGKGNASGKIPKILSDFLSSN